MNIINFDPHFAREIAWCVSYLREEDERFATLNDLLNKVIRLCQMDQLAKDEKWLESARNVTWIAASMAGWTYSL